MKIEQLDPVWAESGDKTDPGMTDEKIAAGQVGGEYLYIERFNALQNRVETLLNSLVVERMNGLYEDAADKNAMLTTKLFDESWGVTSDSANVISAGATKQLGDLAVYFDATTGAPRLMALDYAGNQISVYDARSLALLDTSSDLSADLPSGGGETWHAVSMCTDGTHVYVGFIDTAANTYQIQSWLRSDWSVNTGWAATGTALPGSGAGSFGGVRIGFASSTKLATVNSWNAVSAASSAAISIIDITDGTIDASGAGDCPTGDSAKAVSKFASDGTNIYFGASGSTSGYVCSATIANPQVGCGGSGYPYSMTTPAAGYPIAPVACGAVVALGIYVGSGWAATDSVIQSCTASAAFTGKITRGQNSAGTPVTGDKWVMRIVHDARFDGINLWLVGDIDNLSSGVSCCVVKIDVAKLQANSLSDVAPQLGDVASVFKISPVNASSSSASLRPMSIELDGRDIWVIKENRASQTDSGKIFRLPLAQLRS